MVKELGCVVFCITSPVLSLDNKLFCTLSLFTQCISGDRRHTAGGSPVMV